MAVLPERIVQHALSKVGSREKGGANKGPDIQPFFDADSYDPNGAKPGDDGYAWCAAFCCWAVKKAMEDGGDFTFKRPTTPGAFAFETWSLAQDNSTQTKKNPGRDIKRGDLVIFKFSHIGIALGPPNASGVFPTCEGNTNGAGSREGDGVYQKARSISSVKTRIRFTV